ncbi:MAG: AAA family ATPase, partial [Fusobacteriaceae bacterium]
KKLKREEEIMSETLLNLERVMEKRESEIKISQLQRENLYLQMQNFLREGSSLEKLRERKITLIEEKKYLNLKNISEKIEVILGEISELEKNFGILSEKKIVLEKSKIKKIEKIEVLKNEIKDLADYEENLGKEKKDLGNIEGKLLELKQSYELYSRNITVALKLESFREKELSLKNNIERISFGIEKLGENLQKLREELSKKISLYTLQAEKKAIEESITDLHRESGALLSIIVALKERAKKSEEDFIEIESLEEREKTLQKKHELTQKFRENIKVMGEKVAESIIRRIAFFATENFRKITGRSESIIWSGKDSSGKDSPYSVLLEGADREGNLRKVNFDQLSGGEQVAVAISIRGAMNSIFTKTGFSIFDEPTNNLDQERRKILADNIGEILENMEQSIIVTHDDTFKEMAQQVIEL